LFGLFSIKQRTGLFIVKFLLNFYKDTLKVIIDPSNSFVLLSVNLGKIEVTFLDSMRLFPVSLDNLCKTFNVEGKISKYQPEYNEVALFDNMEQFNEFTKYALQDSIGLYKALINAQLLYNSKYMVDITSSVSISSLSFKIFRQEFLKINIPILDTVEDSFVRGSYFGGATDYYRKYGELFLIDTDHVSNIVCIITM
jgi:hypothetical protein